jgi:hypothetical protein
MEATEIVESHGGNLLGTTLQEVAEELTHEPDAAAAEAAMDIDPITDDVDQAVEDAIPDAAAE